MTTYDAKAQGCFYCNVNPYTDCPHREAPRVRDNFEPPIDKRKDRNYEGQGHNFKGRKLISGGGNYRKKHNGKARSSN